MRSQIDEDDAPLRASVDQLARDAAPVTAGSKDAMGEHEPRGGRRVAARDKLVMKGGRHVRTMACGGGDAVNFDKFAKLSKLTASPHSSRVDLGQLARAGFDIAHAFDARSSTHPALAGGPRSAILVGNTRALWPPFVEAMKDPELARSGDPLDAYTERTLDAVFAGARVLYGHRQYDGAYIPLQHIAAATGLGAMAESHLVIHPVYGPWFALRAVVLVDGEPDERTPIAKPCVCDETCPRALDRALTGGDWRAWLSVRDACSLRDWRYSDEQIAYHYTKVWRR